MKGNLVTAVAGIAAELLVEPVANVINDNVIHQLIRAVFSKDISKLDEIRHREALQIKDNEERGSS